LTLLPFFGRSLIKLAHDGLDREFKFFNRLEGGVCTMCAPGDQRKSSNNQAEQAELNALQCRCETCFGRAMVSHRQAINLRRSIPEKLIAKMRGYGKAACGAKRPSTVLFPINVTAASVICYSGWMPSS
jgi:hypothetical protein